MERQHQLYLLGGLLTVWGAVAAWTVFDEPEPARVALTNVGGTALGGQMTSARSTPRLKVNLEQLFTHRGQGDDAFVSPTNIFTLYHPVGSSGTSSPTAGPVPIPEPHAVSPEEQRQQAAWQELSQFRYLGYFQMGLSSADGEGIALLAKDQVLYVARAGDLIEGRVRVKTVSTSEIRLEETDSKVEQRLVLAEGE